MQSTEGTIGRVFVLRLGHGDVIPDSIEQFAAEKGVSVGHVILIGAVDKGEVVTGPRSSDEIPPNPILLPVEGAHEVAGVGVLAPDDKGKPVLHIHAVLGRAGQSLSGCLRPGVATWLIGEVIVYEILGVNLKRLMDKKSGFKLLEVLQ